MKIDVEIEFSDGAAPVRTKDASLCELEDGVLMITRDNHVWYYPVHDNIRTVHLREHD